MAEHLETGQYGEQLAVDYFAQNGYVILHKNWRYGHHEIDLIAIKAGVIHFIEVKTRTSAKWGYPEEEVTAQKFKSIKTAAAGFMRQSKNWKRVQYDVLSITLKPSIEYFLIEDIYL